MKKTTVISLGGSLINPNQIDTLFLKQFVQIIEKLATNKNKFIIITGGGKPAREYQAALRQITKPSPDDLDWMGIAATRFNAELLKYCFSKIAAKNVITDFSIRQPTYGNVILAGGWKPGRSSDGAAVVLASIYGADVLINFTDVDYVYDKDPKMFPEAKKIENISWDNFLKNIIGTKWVPGKKVPFDPTAAKFAQRHKLKVIIADGKNLKNLKNILNHKEFIGTTII
jgi:uridylate kinase